MVEISPCIWEEGFWAHGSRTKWCRQSMCGETSGPFTQKWGQEGILTSVRTEVSVEGGIVGWVCFLLLSFSSVEKHIRTHWKCPQDFWALNVPGSYTWLFPSIPCLFSLPKCPAQEPSRWHLVGWRKDSVQSLSHVRLLATPWATARQSSLSITNSQSLPKLMSIESVMPSSHLIPSYYRLARNNKRTPVLVIKLYPVFHLYVLCLGKKSHIFLKPQYFWLLVERVE